MSEVAHPAGDTMLMDMPFRRGDLYRVRATIAAYANRLGSAADQIDKLVLVASELVVNAVSHGGGRGRLRLWSSPSSFLCEVSDSGPGIPDPAHAGLRAPVPGVAGNRGLWVVRSLAEAVDIETGPHGTTVTARVRMSD